MIPGKAGQRGSKRKRQRKSISRESSKKDSVKYKNYLKQHTANGKILRSKTTKETPVVNTDCPTIVKMAFPAFSRSLNKAKKSLPKEPVQKRVIEKDLFEDSIQATPKKILFLSAWLTYMNKITKRQNIRRPVILTEDVREKLDSFLCRHDKSFTLPGRNNQVSIGKNKQGKSLFKPKKYLL